MDIRKDLLEINCPVTLTQKVISGKWKILIIYLLKDGIKRFGELQKQIPDITQGYLTQQLKELVEDGLVHREVYKVVPPKVEYSLTDIGMQFLSVTEQMRDFGIQYMKFINK